MNTIKDEIESISDSEENSLDNELAKKNNTIKNGNLESIKEKDEEGLNNIPKMEEIKNLRQKITELESRNLYLQKRNNELTKDNIRNDTKLKRVSFVGTRKNFFFENKKNNFEMTELIKEKNDLQEINEKMLDILTQKEIEISKLNESLNNLKNEKIKQEENYILFKIFMPSF